MFRDLFNVSLGLADDLTSVSASMTSALTCPATDTSQRYLIVDLSIHNTANHGCSARVLWNVVTIALKPGRSPPTPRPMTLERDGVRIQLPSDPLTEPIFCIFHRLGDVVLSVSLCCSWLV